jgi:hypothetical protein
VIWAGSIPASGTIPAQVACWAGSRPDGGTEASCHNWPMAAPKFSPVTPIDTSRGYESPDHVPDGWTADRPAEVVGRQPVGARLGFQGPDQGYALTLAARLRPEVQVQHAESVDDALSGCTAIALRRASMYGRAPIMPDLRIALTMWGFLDPSPPPELVDARRPAFLGVADSLHGYENRRALVDAIPEPSLRQTPDQVTAAYPANWRALLGR